MNCGQIAFFCFNKLPRFLTFPFFFHQSDLTFMTQSSRTQCPKAHQKSASLAIVWVWVCVHVPENKRGRKRGGWNINIKHIYYLNNKEQKNIQRICPLDLTDTTYGIHVAMETARSVLHCGYISSEGAADGWHTIYTVSNLFASQGNNWVLSTVAFWINLGAGAYLLNDRCSPPGQTCK